MVEADLLALGRAPRDRVFTGLMGTLSSIEDMFSGALSVPITEIGEDCTGGLAMRNGLLLRPLRTLAFEEN